MFEGVFRRRKLPHWDVEDGTYFVTACLEGSVPALGLVELHRYRLELEQRTRPENLNDFEWEIHKQKLAFARFDNIIDCRPAARHLADVRLANEVRNSLYHFAGERYDLLAFVIMPSHFHWVFHPKSEWVERINDQERTPREIIMHSIRSYTANVCNRLLQTAGAFWQKESYDHIVRGHKELLRIIEYVERNPVQANLVADAALWRWSSAHDRLRRGVPFGEPLLPCDLE